MLQSVIDGVMQAREAIRVPRLVYRCSELHQSKNQYCLFLKPWVTMPESDLYGVMDLVLDKIKSRDLSIDEVVILPGCFLDRHQVMVEHYGRLNLLAKDAATKMSELMRCKFRAIFGADVDEVTVLGGFEFLQRFKDVSPFGLELLWENIEQHQLGSGAFCGKATIGNGSVFLVNGFVPNLMRMYAHPQSVVVVFSIHGALSWTDARSVFVGTADPARAASGSLRNEFFERQTDLGLSDIRLGANGVHLSAGPVEALVEFCRFMSTVSPWHRRTASDFQFGRKLRNKFTAREIDVILENPTVHLAGKNQSIFDLTEEMDEDTAVEFLASLRYDLFHSNMSTDATP